MTWYVYIIECSDSTYYTGITTDLLRRFKQHANGCGAKYFNGREPIKIVYSEDGHTKSTASKRENEIKNRSRKYKLKLISEN